MSHHVWSFERYSFKKILGSKYRFFSVESPVSITFSANMEIPNELNSKFGGLNTAGISGLKSPPIRAVASP